MKINQLPPLPTPKFTETIRGVPCITVTEHEHLMRAFALQARAQATQAEVTDGIRPEDFTVDVVVKPMGGFAPVNTKGVRVTHKPTGVSVTCDAARSQHTNRQQAFETLRTILALRPDRVPMTDEVEKCAVVAWAHFMDTCRKKRVSPADWGDWCSASAIRKAHHGITAQAKKDQA